MYIQGDSVNVSLNGSKVRNLLNVRKYKIVKKKPCSNHTMEYSAASTTNDAERHFFSLPASAFCSQATQSEELCNEPFSFWAGIDHNDYNFAYNILAKFRSFIISSTVNT